MNVRDIEAGAIQASLDRRMGKAAGMDVPDSRNPGEAFLGDGGHNLPVNGQRRRCVSIASRDTEYIHYKALIFMLFMVSYVFRSRSFRMFHQEFTNRQVVQVAL